MSSASPDHPRMAAAVGRVEPAPRRVRGLLGDVVAFDTTEARYVWEVPYYPQYYIPLTDVRQDVIETHTSAVRVFHDGPLAGLVRFDWDALTWFEEDEQIHVHPRNPYTRVDALRSNRHVVVSRDEVVLADTRSPVLLFETGLPTRYYIDRMNVRFDRLEPSDTTSHCPYKGVTSGYWSVRIGDGVHRDLAWSYDYPLPAVSAISGLVAFYNEKVDISVDGRALDRPRTHFS